MGGAWFAWCARCILGEWNVDAVYLLMVLLALLRSKGVRLLGLFWPYVGISITHAMISVFQTTKVNQRLCLELLVLIAFDADTIISSLSSRLALGLLHGGLGWLFGTFRKT